MGWCHRCRTEYRPGITDCPKCGSAILPDPPGPAAPRAILPETVRQRLRAFSAAWRYALEAAVWIRRHPIILLLPLALSGLDATEKDVAFYMQFGGIEGNTDTRFLDGRPFRVARPLTLREEAKQALYRAMNPLWGISVMAYPLPTMDFSGSVSYVVQRRLQAEPDSDPRLLWSILVYMPSALLAVLIRALVGSGFCTVIARSGLSRAPDWRGFRPGVRTFFLRFLAFGGITKSLSVIEVSAILIVGPGHPAWEWPYIKWVLMTSGLALMVLLCLTPIVLALTNTGLFSAMRASIAAMRRRPGIPLVFLLGIVIITAIATFIWEFGGLLMAAHLRPVGEPWGPGLFALSCAWGGIGDLVRALVATWFLVAAFAWCREELGLTAETAELAGLDALSN